MESNANGNRLSQMQGTRSDTCLRGAHDNSVRREPQPAEAWGDT
jgi:hypothetical protein